MKRVLIALAAVLACLALPQSGWAATNVLTFEGLQDNERIEQFYNGGAGSLGSVGPDYDIEFGSDALALKDADAGGNGDFANEPSPDTIAFFLSGPGVVMNVAGGFQDGFSFFYTSFGNASVTVYDGLNATGNVVDALTLAQNYNAGGCTGDPTGEFCHWDPIGVTFAGTARSVSFGGAAGAVGFDEVTIGSDTPGGPPTQWSVSDVTDTEGNAGTKAFTFNVTRSDGVASASVDYTVNDDTATIADNDYVDASGTVSFASGETSKPVTVLVNGDTKIEPDETFTIDLSNATGGVIVDSEGVGTIVNDDKNEISINDVSKLEGNSGTTPFVFTVSRAPGAGSSSVAYQVVHGTTNDADLTLSSGAVSFVGGETSKPVTVLVTGDTIDEPNEQFTVKLSNPVNATIVDETGIGTIIDDDRSGAFSCRAVGVRLAGIETALSNGPNAPCKDASASVLDLSLESGALGLGAKLISSSTSQTPDDLVNTLPALDDRSEADAAASSVVLVAGLSVVRASVVTVHAEARCGSPRGSAPKLSSSMTITNLTVNGQPVVVGDGEVKIGLLLGVLHVNNTTTTATSITKRGIWFENKIQSSSSDIVVAEAKANFLGNPCK